MSLKLITPNCESFIDRINESLWGQNEGGEKLIKNTNQMSGVLPEYYSGDIPDIWLVFFTFTWI